MTSARPGRMRCLSWVSGEDPPGKAAVTGNHLRRTPNTMIRAIADTNSGMAVSESPPTVMIRSTGRPLRNAASDAAEDPRRDDEEKRDRRELERVDERRLEQAPDRHLVLQGVAHVAPDEAGDPVEVLRQDRPVDAELVIQDVDRLLVGERPEHGTTDVARKQVRDREHGDAQEEERDDAQCEPPEEEADQGRHASLLLTSVASAADAGGSMTADGAAAAEVSAAAASIHCDDRRCST